MRLIDADALSKAAHNKFKKALDSEECDRWDVDVQAMANGTLQALFREAPTIEAEPVVHAHWEYPDMYDWGWPCSHCAWDNGEWDKPKFKFCPNCGAKMDEK